MKKGYIESFNQEFCEFLEFHLCKTFKNSKDIIIRSLWCDGIICIEFNKKQVNDNKRQIITSAWIGKDGQGEYEMKINFGEYSWRRIVKGTEMIDCIPESDNMDWINLEIEERRIEINLK